MSGVGWVCPKCGVTYGSSGTMSYCTQCGGQLEALPEQPHLLHSERNLAEQEHFPSLEEHLRHLKGQIHALEGQARSLGEQRAHLLGQVHALEDWVKQLRGAAAKRDNRSLKFSGRAGHVPSEEACELLGLSPLQQHAAISAALAAISGVDVPVELPKIVSD